jgi:hypothetical protein
MDPPLIDIPIPGPYYELDGFTLTGLYVLIVYIDYYLYCRTSIPYQKYKKWVRAFHITVPFVLAPANYTIATTLISYPWFIASVGAYSAELYKKKHLKDSSKPQSFMDWIKSIGREGLLRDLAMQPDGTIMTKSQVRLEGLWRTATNFTVLLLANRFLNSILLDDPYVLLSMPWYSLECIYHCLLMGIKGYTLMSTNDIQLSICQMVFGLRTIKAFNKPFMATRYSKTK